MKLFLFDVDMTLIYTGGAGVRALDYAFHAVLGLPGAMRDIQPQGKTDLAIIREACVKQGFNSDVDPAPEILGRYVARLVEEVERSEGYRVLPGVVDLLETLSRRDGAVLGLATGNLEAGARIKLERGGLNAFFPFGGFGGECLDRVDLVREAARKGAAWSRHLIGEADTYVIGDTPRDVAAGRAAGFRTVAVATGHYSVDDLGQTGADLVVENLEAGKDQFLRSTRMA